MRAARQLSITLPGDLADALAERVASGAYASESDVVRDGIRVLFSQEESLEQWLRTEAVAAYDEMRDDPSQAMSAHDMRAHFDKLHQQHAA